MKSLGIIIIFLLIIAILELGYLCILIKTLDTQQAGKPGIAPDPSVSSSQNRSSYTPSASTRQRIVKGQPFPELEFVCIQGRTHKIHELKGSVIVIEFWATWCGPCRAVTPYLADVYEKFKDKGLAVFGISLDENKSALLDYLQEHRIPWPQYYDGLGWENKLWRKLGKGGIPMIAVIDKKGIVRYSDIDAAQLEKAVAELLGEPGPALSNDRISESKESVFDKPFHERIHGVMWDGQGFKVVFAGEQNIAETKLGPIDRWADGLAFHPDGRIAFSFGNGTTPDMMLAFWTPFGIGESVADLEYARRSETEDRDASEEQGLFWFFSGPMAFGPDGTCYFSLGPCCPNGLYKVISNSPVRIEKLYSLDATRSLQIPLFDTDHLYSTSWNGIFRYPIEPDGKKHGVSPWFSVAGDRITLWDCLIISSNQVIAEILFRMPKGSSEEDYYVKSLLFDRNEKVFRVLPGNSIGPMAISGDGQRMIRFDKSARAINEFSLTNR